MLVKRDTVVYVTGFLDTFKLTKEITLQCMGLNTLRNTTFSYVNKTRQQIFINLVLHTLLLMGDTHTLLISPKRTLGIATS